MNPSSSYTTCVIDRLSLCKVISGQAPSLCEFSIILLSIQFPPTGPLPLGSRTQGSSRGSRTEVLFPSLLERWKSHERPLQKEYLCKRLVRTSPSPSWPEQAGGLETPGPPKFPSAGSALGWPQWGSCLRSSVLLWLHFFFPSSTSMVNRRHQISFHPLSLPVSTHQTDVFHLSFLHPGKARF